MNKWCDPLMRCVEGLYVIEEETYRIIWANKYLTDGLGADIIGKTCWEALLKRDSPCPFCPKLLENNITYVWDYYDPASKRWVKVKHLMFREDGVLYRVGNVNTIDDVMLLNYETVQEIATLQTVLKNNAGELAVLAKEAIYDNLTGLYNRNCFHMDLVRCYTDVPNLGALYFDLNNLKEINDRYHHQAGDTLLRRLARAMLHTSNQSKGVKCYRVGGDEFVMMITNCSEDKLTQLKTIFHSYLDAYNKNEEYICSVAIGQAFSEESCNAETLVSQADNQMYQVKQKMKECDN